MAFDSTKPADHAPIVAAELRSQFNALQAQIAALQAQVAALQSALNGKASAITWSEYDPGIHNPPTFDDVEGLRLYVNNLVTQLTS